MRISQAATSFPRTSIFALVLLAAPLACDGGGTQDSESSASGETSGGDSESAGEDTGRTECVTQESPTLSDDLRPVFEEHCMDEGCHGATTTPGSTLYLDVSYADDPLFGILGDGLADVPRVTPCDPEKSLLWHKVNGTQASVGDDGVRMPAQVMDETAGPCTVKADCETGFSCVSGTCTKAVYTEDEPLDQASIDLIEAWILAGAPI